LVVAEKHLEQKPKQRKKLPRKTEKISVKIVLGGCTATSGGSTAVAVAPLPLAVVPLGKISARTDRDLGGNCGRKSSKKRGNWQFQGWGTPRRIDHTLEHQIYGTKPQETQQNERSIQRKFGAIFLVIFEFSQKKNWGKFVDKSVATLCSDTI